VTSLDVNKKNKNETANRAYGRDDMMQLQSNGLKEENLSIVININWESEISIDDNKSVTV
jgi:hypothetical protein